MVNLVQGRGLGPASVAEPWTFAPDPEMSPVPQRPAQEKGAPSVLQTPWRSSAGPFTKDYIVQKLLMVPELLMAPHDSRVSLATPHKSWQSLLLWLQMEAEAQSNPVSSSGAGQGSEPWHPSPRPVPILRSPLQCPDPLLVSTATSSSTWKEQVNGACGENRCVQGGVSQCKRPWGLLSLLESRRL